MRGNDGMSGIAAIYNLDGHPVEAALLDRMLGSIAHRGPDGIDRWHGSSVALGHAMLHATAESIHESQPLRDETGNLVLTLDGRVDNREELTRELSSRGFTPRDDTDAELVMRAYQCWGHESAVRIIGDFAYAIWDGRERELFCARDPVGVKPLYYFTDGRFFVCGSELREVMSHPGVPRTVNEGMVAEFLCDIPLDLEETLFDGVLRLVPGHYLVVRPDGVIRRSFYTNGKRFEIRYRDDREYADHFREIFAEAVQCRMRNPGSGVAAELSGGLDSSSVVSMAEHLRRRGVVAADRLETFSLIYDAPESDERDYIHEVLRKWNLTANLLPPTPFRIDESRERTRRSLDMDDYPNGVSAYSIYESAAKKGFQVLLTGIGGDDWFSSGDDEDYSPLLRELRLFQLFRRLREGAEVARASREPMMGSLSRLLRYGIFPLIPQGVKNFIKPLIGRMDYPRWIPRERARRTHLLARRRRQYRPPPRVGFMAADPTECLMHPYAVFSAERTEYGTAANGVEARHPFNDRRLIELACAIPENQLRRGVFYKFVLREAMRGLLPDKIRGRLDKATFPGDFLVAFEHLTIPSLLEKSALASAAWIERNKAAAGYEDMMLKVARRGVFYQADFWPMFGLGAIELWCEEVLSLRGSGSALAVAA